MPPGPAPAPAPAAAFVAYYRVSTDKQAASGLGLGLAAQRHAPMAREPRGGAGGLVAEFEEAESGRPSARPQLLRALAAARRHRATLVVAKLDRLTRDPRLLGTLRDARVRFVAADNPHATEFTVDILAAVAADEARRTAERAHGPRRAVTARPGPCVGSTHPRGSRASCTAVAPAYV